MVLFVLAFPVGVVVAEVRVVSAHTVCSLHEGPPEICRSALGHAFTRCYTLTGLTFCRVHANIGHELVGTIEALSAPISPAIIKASAIQMPGTLSSHLPLALSSKQVSSNSTSSIWLQTSSSSSWKSLSSKVSVFEPKPTATDAFVAAFSSSAFFWPQLEQKASFSVHSSVHMSLKCVCCGVAQCSSSEPLGGPKRAAEQAVEDGCGAVFEHGRSVLRAHSACSA